jgi:hypothetical protein
MRQLGIADFEGDWAIDRVIDDRTGGPAGRFTGTGRFARRPWGLAYAEEGELALGAAVMRATRSYRWVFGADGVEVFFADGRIFHGFRFDAAGADHLCGDDLYRVAYDFAAWPVWQAVWDVTGPRKDYAMRSVYRRAG